MYHTPNQLIGHLQTARQQHPELAGTIDLHCDLLQLQSRIPSPQIPATPAAPAMEQALAGGTPLLHLVQISFDREALARFAADVCRLIANHRPDLRDALAALQPNLDRCLEQLANWKYNDPASPSAPPGPAPDLLAFVLTQTRRPFLQAAINNILPTISNFESITPNPKPVCPMCGGPPDFAALTPDRQSNGHGRQLLCACCDTEWGYKRGGCPFCGREDQWAYFPDENEIFRLYVCDACHRYLKTVDWRQTFAHRCLPVERVITADMDVAARQAGYT